MSSQPLGFLKKWQQLLQSPLKLQHQPQPLPLSLGGINRTSTKVSAAVAATTALDAVFRPGSTTGSSRGKRKGDNEDRHCRRRRVGMRKRVGELTP
mmetsp:Transcript_5545/g.9646  ORF Transcript_5545/g.9646 Transcript_5545/m.9646 type:complete len:96 (-) Transcript_5545:55-342(-)